MKTKFTNNSKNTLQKIPYGNSNFRNLIEENNIYVDKTPFIELLEDNYKFVSFLRPRRFGKSLFVSTLSYYYDEYYKDICNDLFKDTYIGNNPSPKKSSYRVLLLEFSGIVTTDIKSIYRGFTFAVKTVLEGYLKKYNYSNKDFELISSLNAPEDLMKKFFEIVKGDKVYILIDEYDNFANSILGESIETFKNILSKGGFVRGFYETIKTATLSGVVEKVFITGVTPITMDTMTSGFNIVESITKDEEFNELAGFTLSETKGVLNYVFEQCKDVNQAEVIENMMNLYNGYKFNINAENKIFNSTMVMFFVKKFDIKRCKYPSQLLDVNVASDYRKIMQLFEIGDIEDNYKVLQELIKTNKIVATLKERFEFDKGFDRDDFVTLLYSLGFITIKDTFLTKTEFMIPNYTIKTLYFDYFKIELENRTKVKFNTKKIEDSIIELALNNNINLLQKEVLNVIRLLSNRDFMKFDEKNLKVILLTLLNFSSFYHIKSEAEHNRYYPDIMLLEQKPFETKFQYLFELKWAKKTIKGDWENKKEEGIAQVKGYLKLDDIKKLKSLHAYLIIADVDRLEIIEVD